MLNKFELLMPAGNYEKGVYALEYGADAIYIGPKAYSLRARSSNFDFSDIQKIVEYAHSIGKKVYVVLNIICHNAHMPGFIPFFKKLNEINVDAAIVADPYIFEQIKKINPDFEIHVSTQQSVCNSKAAMFWKRNNASRVVLGRETSYQELEMLDNNLNQKVELEYFIHGAVCISYSGRCMMSNNFSLRDANVGGCAQSCRWKYKVMNFPTDKYFTMSAKDMALLENIEQLMKLNVNSFKVEGRMKSVHYVATIAACYKYVMNCIQNNIPYDINKVKKELEKAENRLTSNAWFDKNPNKDKMLYFEQERSLLQNFAFIFVEKINKYEFKILSKNFFRKDEEFEMLMPNLENIIFKIKKIKDKNGNEIDVVNQPSTEFIITTSIDIDNFKNKIVRVCGKL